MNNCDKTDLGPPENLPLRQNLILQTQVRDKFATVYAKIAMLGCDSTQRRNALNAISEADYLVNKFLRDNFEELRQVAG